MEECLSQRIIWQKYTKVLLIIITLKHFKDAAIPYRLPHHWLHLPHVNHLWYKMHYELASERKNSTWAHQDKVYLHVAQHIQRLKNPFPLFLHVDLVDTDFIVFFQGHCADLSSCCKLANLSYFTFVLVTTLCGAMPM